MAQDPTVTPTTRVSLGFLAVLLPLTLGPAFWIHGAIARLNGTIELLSLRLITLEAKVERLETQVYALENQVRSLDLRVQHPHFYYDPETSNPR